jgi:hypothetical protein
MTKKRKPRRHPFYFSIEGDGEKRVPKPILVDVVDAKEPVDVTLTAAHARRSIKLKGRGNTQTCPGSLCLKDHSALFPHKTDGHFVDWLYNRAFVSCAVNAYGLPTKFVRYAHDTSFAQLQDLLGGQQKLLAKLEKDGPLVIRLRPPPKHGPQPKGRPEGGRNGSRKPKTAHVLGGLRGAKRRRAVVALGLKVG